MIDYRMLLINATGQIQVITVRYNLEVGLGGLDRSIGEWIVPLHVGRKTFEWESLRFLPEFGLPDSLHAFFFCRTDRKHVNSGLLFQLIERTNSAPIPGSYGRRTWHTHIRTPLLLTRLGRGLTPADLSMLTVAVPRARRTATPAHPGDLIEPWMLPPTVLTVQRLTPKQTPWYHRIGVVTDERGNVRVVDGEWRPKRNSGHHGWQTWEEDEAEGDAFRRAMTRAYG